MKTYELYIRHVYDGVTQAQLARENGTSANCIHQIIAREKAIRKYRKDPKRPTVEDLLERFDEEHGLNKHNGSVKAWRAIWRSFSEDGYIHICDYTEEGEKKIIAKICSMTLDDFLAIKGIGFVYAAIFDDFRKFLSEIYQQKE